MLHQPTQHSLCSCASLSAHQIRGAVFVTSSLPLPLLLPSTQIISISESPLLPCRKTPASSWMLILVQIFARDSGPRLGTRILKKKTKNKQTNKQKKRIMRAPRHPRRATQIHKINSGHHFCSVSYTQDSLLRRLLVSLPGCGWKICSTGKGETICPKSESQLAVNLSVESRSVSSLKLHSH